MKSSRRIQLEDRVILAAARSLRFLVRILPLRASLALGWCLGNVAYYATKRRRIAYQNLRAVFASEKSRRELKRISRRSIRNLAMSTVELFRFPDLTSEYVRRHVRIEGLEKLERVRVQKKGIIFLTAHFGNWELLNIVGGLTGYPMAALARPQKHPRSDAYLNSLRMSKGGRMVMKGMQMRRLVKVLHAGGIVGMLSDQDGGKEGVFVRFFGRMSSTPSGVATFALKTDSLVFPAFCFREGWTRHRIELEGPLEMPPAGAAPEEAERFILQQFADVLEKKVRKSPEQWLWAHRRWKSTPDRRVAVLSDGKAGHLNQSMAVVRAIGEERAAQGYGPRHLAVERIEVRYKNPFWRRMVQTASWITGGHLPFAESFFGMALEKDSWRKMERTHADIVVSCGSSLAALNRWMKSENVARSAVVMRPPLPSGGFDAVVVPSHDKMRPAENVFVTEAALPAFSAEDLKRESENLGQELGLSPGARIGLLLGGDTDKTKFSPEALKGILGGLLDYCERSKASLLVTTSRRTPVWADGMLRKLLGGSDLCRFLVIANEANRKGAVEGILGLSDVVLVSGESVSMVSEAVGSGKPVIVFMPSGREGMKRKHEAFLENLERQKRILLISGDVDRALQNTLAKKNGFHGLSGDAEVLKRAAKRLIG